MDKHHKFLVPCLRKGLLGVMEGNVRGIRKRKLSKGSKEVVEDARGSKQRKTSLDNKNKSIEKTENKKTKKKETEESVWLNCKRVLPLGRNKKGSCLLFMKKNQAFAVQGKVWLHMLQGTINIMGYRMTPGQKTCLFSPRYSSLLTIKDCTNTGNTTTHPMVKSLVNFQSQQVKKTAITRAQKASSVLLLTKTDTVETDYLCQFKEYMDCFSTSKDGDNNNVILNEEEKEMHDLMSPLGFMLVEASSESFQVYEEPEELINTMNNITQSPGTSSKQNGCKSQCFLVCGGKGVGKSSFARYMLNTLLNSCSEVCYLECDVGQTELTPPAVLSLNHVTTPLLGPPFTQLKWPERAHFFGDVSPKANSIMYINIINSLYQYYQEKYMDKNIPLVVNTLGWVKGLGIPLLMDVIRIVHPSHIMQINSPTQTNKNLPTITSDFLETSPGLLHLTSMEEKDQNNKILLDGLIDNLRRDDKDTNLGTTGPVLRQGTRHSYCQPTIFHLTSCSEVNQATGPHYTASDHRTMALLAYFSQVQDSGDENNDMPKPTNSLMECKPYKVPWSHVAVHVIHTEVPRSQILFSLNASVVGLAVSPNKVLTEARNDSDDLPKFLNNTPIVECVGLGIVRNIDPVNKLFYILTPVPLEELHRVNTLLKGNLEIPAALLLKEKRPSAPYVSSEFSYDLKGVGVRKVRYNLQRGNLNST